MRPCCSSSLRLLGPGPDVIFRSLVFAAGFTLGAVAQALAQAATPAPAPLPAPTVSISPAPTPAATLTPVPTPPTPPPTPTPTATPESPYKYIVEPTPSPSAAPDAPQIVRVELSDQTLHVGGPVAIRITTSVNVQRVWASTQGQNIDIIKAQDGIFAGMTTLPGFVPPWF